jgi:hypothetical protein
MGWPSEYLAILRNPLLDADPGRMPGFRGLAAALSWPMPVYIIAAVTLYILLGFISRRLSAADGLAVALAFAVIAAPHCRVYDGVALIPLFVRVASLKSATGLLACLGLTPVLYLLVLTGNVPLMAAGEAVVIAATLAASLSLLWDKGSGRGGLAGTAVQTHRAFAMKLVTWTLPFVIATGVTVPLAGMILRANIRDSNDFKSLMPEPSVFPRAA